VLNRTLRIVRGPPLLGICENCNMQFSGGLSQLAKSDIQQQFNLHNCKREDVNQAPAPLHLISDGNLKRCSVCGYPFQPDVKPSMSVAFASHLRKAHQPGQTTEDVTQVAKE
jgi:hypothetical protein